MKKFLSTFLCGSCMSIFHKIFLLFYFVFHGLLTSKMIVFMFFIFFSENALEERGEGARETGIQIFSA